MYVITSGGKTVGKVEQIIHIRLHENGCYVPCDASEAEGFCVKLAATRTDEDGNEYQEVADTVFHRPGRTLKGTEPEGFFEAQSVESQLDDAMRMLAELEEAYDRSEISEN